MKKLTSVILAGILLVGAAAGCSSGTGQSGSSEQSIQSGETKKFTIWSRDTEDSMTGRAFKSDLAAFQALHPEIEFDYMHLSFADTVTKWNTAFAGGIAPDVMDVGVSHIVSLVNLGQIVPLDERYSSWEDKENYPDNMLEYGKYNDQVYAMAYNSSPPIFSWRKDYFEEAGLDPERPPESWAECLEYAQKLTVMDGDKMVRGGVELMDTRGAQILWQLFLQNDAPIVDYENDKPNFNDPEAIEAAQFLQDLSPYAMLNSAGGTGVYLSGNAAMVLHILPESLINMVKENPSLEDKLGYAPSLRNKKGGIHAGAWLYALSSQCRDTELGWEWITFVLSEERCRARMNEVDIVPPLKSLSDEYLKTSPEIHQAQLDNLQQSQAYPKLSWTNIFEETLHRAYDQVLYKEKTPEQAMLDLDAEIMSKKAH